MEVSIISPLSQKNSLDPFFWSYENHALRYPSMHGSISLIHHRFRDGIKVLKFNLTPNIFINSYQKLLVKKGSISVMILKDGP
jgi:hypothetical protein